jgi:hypothetical protein
MQPQRNPGDRLAKVEVSASKRSIDARRELTGDS